MGIYYEAVCDDLKERIDPGNINDLGNKLLSISHPQHPFGQVVVFAMAHRWVGKAARIVDDLGEDYQDLGYKEVTEEVLTDYNKIYGTKLNATIPIEETEVTQG